jgi:hypothetical protein
MSNINFFQSKFQNSRDPQPGLLRPRTRPRTDPGCGSQETLYVGLLRPMAVIGVRERGKEREKGEEENERRKKER